VSLIGSIIPESPSGQDRLTRPQATEITKPAGTHAPLPGICSCPADPECNRRSWIYRSASSMLRVIALAERLQLIEIATLVQRHFAVVRPSHTRAFIFLPGSDA
jgi:hypothetical protein